MKRHIQSALLAAALLAPAAAGAFTTRELCDVAWIATYRTNKNYNESGFSTSAYIDSHGVTAERIDDTHLRLNGIQGCLDFVFTLTDASGNATADGEYLCINVNDNAVNVSSPDYASQTWQMRQCQYTRFEWPVYVYSNTASTFLLKIDHDGDGYKMLSTSPLFVHGSADNTTGGGYLVRIFDQVEFNSFIPNAWMSDRFIESYGYTTNASGNITSFYPTSTERKRQYPVRVEMDYSKNRFSILNFGNNGYGMRENQKYYLNTNNGATVSADGKFTIGGSFDPATKKLTFDQNQFAKPIIAQYVNYYYIFDGVFNFQLERLDLENGTTVDELFGGYDDTKGVHHNSAENGWVSHGGKRRTLEDLSMEVETYTYYLNQFLYERPNFEGGYYDTQIDCGDVTLWTEFVRQPSASPARQASDPLAHVSYTQFNGGNDVSSDYYDGVKEWGIVPVMNVIRNEKYVDSYEIMAVPGTYTTAAEVQAHIGEAVEFRRVFINNGTALTQAEGAPVFSADALKEGLYKPGDFRIERKTSGATGEPYTFFIRASYKPETGLTPTYHDVYPYTFYSDIPTSAEVIEFGSFSVEGTRGGLLITDAPADVTVTDLSGRTVYTGRDASVALPAGVYIARCGRTARKVQVR